MDIVIYADGGRSIGYGHLVRTGALAAEVLQSGHTVRYISATPTATREIVPDGIEVLPVESTAELLKAARSAEMDILVTDSYAIDAALQQRLASTVPRLGAIMDRSRYPVCCDLLINGNIYALDLDYEWTGSEPTWCLGTDYVLLREEIRTLADTEPPWNDVSDRALVTMGGTDMTNLTPRVVRAFDGTDLTLDAIVGPGFSETQERSVRAAADEISAEVVVTRDPGDLPERMFQADFAVSTASTTTYELLALGTPIISIPVVDNQEPIATALRERDAATVLQRGVDTTEISRAVRQYLSDPAIRKTRRRLGRDLVDGRGTERICAEILTSSD